MTYTLKAYYQKTGGEAHQPVDLDKLHEYVGYTLADHIILTVANRMQQKTNRLPEVQMFFDYGGRAVVAAHLTNRGNVYIEAVETFGVKKYFCEYASGEAIEFEAKDDGTALAHAKDESYTDSTLIKLVEVLDDSDRIIYEFNAE